jgi:tRNA pseudouridine38-40 synthase
VSQAQRYKALVAYVGTDFHGWQIQKNAARTVQAVLEEAIGDLAGSPVRIEGAGRTDAGVHAEGQVMHFDLPRPREPRSVRDAVNRRLPPDVRLLEVAAAEPGFHARFDARWKEYRYSWSRAGVIAPRHIPFVAPLSPRGEVLHMREAARALAGTHDFGIFAVRSSGRESTVRTLHAVSIEEEGAGIQAFFQGDGFLRGMVRSICGVLADAARGRVPPDRAARLLATGDRRLLCAKAPARGLSLVRVSYGD